VLPHKFHSFGHGVELVHQVEQGVITLLLGIMRFHHTFAASGLHLGTKGYLGSDTKLTQRKEKISKIKMETQKTKNRTVGNWNKNCLNNQETHTHELHKERSPLRVRSRILRSRLFSYSKSKFSRYKEILK
jgi:hypothetical protein